MKDVVIHFQRKAAEDLAQKYFLKISGIDRQGKKYEKMRETSLQVKESIDSKLDLKAVLTCFDTFYMNKNQLQLGDETFVCNGFEQLGDTVIKQIYLYILTAGDYCVENESIMNQLYADIWATAYIDAAREILKQLLLERYETQRLETAEKIDISGSFGPGFYGMNINEVGKFFHLLDGSKIGVSVRNNSFIIPLKSCVGFYLIGKDKINLPQKDCVNCIGYSGGCQFCMAI